MRRLFLWLACTLSFPLVQNLALDNVLSIALCVARCSDETCRQSCSPVNAKITQIPLIQKASAANLSLQCKDVNRLVLKHNAGVYVIENRKNHDVVWDSPVISRNEFYQFSNLNAKSRHQYRVRRITAEGVALPEVSEWYETNEENYSPATVKNVSISNIEINKSKPGRLQAHLNIVPAEDLNCLYDVVHWAEGHNLHQYQLDVVKQFGMELEYVEYNSSNTVYVMSKNDVGSRRSKNVTATFRAPSCLQVHNDLRICAPPAVTGLRVSCTRVTRKAVDFEIAWDEPKLRPDSYTVVVEPLDREGNDTVEFAVSGNESVANAVGVAASRQYRIGVLAESAGGSTLQWTLFTGADDQTTGRFQMAIVISTTASLVLIVIVAYIVCRSKVHLAKNTCKYSLFENISRNKGTFEDVISPLKPQSSLSLSLVFDAKGSKTKDKFEITSDRLTIKKVLGSGISGVVKLATLQDDQRRMINVAVKMLRDDANENDFKNFQREISLMKSAGNHKNIVSLIGCCTLNANPLLIVEYCSKGDLLTYLRTILEETVLEIFKKIKRPNTADSSRLFRQDSENFSCTINNYLYDVQQEALNEHKLTPEDLLNIARQVATGMEFLSSNRIVHRDLAARNVLVCADKTVKISDFGLSRDIYQENVYKKQSNDKLPIKWMAIEALTHQVYTTYSDVWSFGILLYEIVTLGGNPYPEWHSSEILHLLKSGYRMGRPSNCGFQLYNIMRACWHENPLNRPTFSQLKQQLDRLLSTITNNEYLNLSELLREPAKYRPLTTSDIPDK